MPFIIVPQNRDWPGKNSQSVNGLLNLISMKRGDKEIEQQLDASLGQPKYFIDTPGLKEGERYSWFPTLPAKLPRGGADSCNGQIRV